MTTSPARARTYAELSEALASIDRTQPGRTFDLLARMLGRTDADLQHRTGISRQTINGKRTGASRVSAKDLWPLAEAVGVDVDVLLLPPSQAARWLAEHRAAQLDHAGNSSRQHNGGEPSTGVDRSRCTATNLTYLLYRDILAGHRRTVAQAA